MATYSRLGGGPGVPTVQPVRRITTGPDPLTQPAPDPQPLAAPRPTAAPSPSASFGGSGGWGGGGDAFASFNFGQFGQVGGGSGGMGQAPQPTAKPPQASSSEKDPQDAALLQPPTLFNLGDPATADPNLGRRSPAMESLLQSFRRKPLY